MASASQAATAPPLDIPSSSSTISVSMIDSTCDLVCTARDSVKPVLKGQTYLNMASWVFYLEHKASGKRLLFDAGSRKDWWNLTADYVEFIEEDMPAIRVEKSINEILREGGVDDQSIDYIIWSHHHFDHIGDSSLFPSTTDLVVGPGFHEKYTPGFPTDPEAVLLDSDFSGRKVNEITFDPPSEQTLALGGFRAHDFFSDGSLYLLDTPGHAPAHLSALVRTTPTTFVFLGGDICDAPQAFRPTAYLPIPDPLPATVPLDARFPRPCPCSRITKCHPAGAAAAPTTPFCDLADGEMALYDDPETAQQSVDAMKVFDADPNVLVCVAHDAGLGEVVELFPKGTLNQWRERGWKEACAWAFVNELPTEEGEPGRPLKVEGLFREGKLVRGAQAVLDAAEKEEEEEDGEGDEEDGDESK